MANRIQPLRRTGSTGVPVVADMLDGEIAVNAFDKKIFMRVGDNLIEVANAAEGGGGSAPATTVIVVTTNLTLSGNHLNCMLEKTGTGALTMTLPPNYGNPGDAIMFMNSGTSGNLTISRGSGVALWTYGSNANLVIPQRRSALLVRATAANTWIRA